MTIRTDRRPVAVHGPARISVPGLLAWLVEANRRYRESVKLRNMPEARLRDIGLSRDQADRAFLRRFGGRG